MERDRFIAPSTSLIEQWLNGSDLLPESHNNHKRASELQIATAGIPEFGMAEQAAPFSTFTQSAAQSTVDSTGQTPLPDGFKNNVTATVWEDEGTRCFQVHVQKTLVARREDNDMINGTRMLTVASLSRGRRDGILKSQRIRHVVTIGPTHLKGVWITYKNALKLANEQRITEILYPLFARNIGTFICPQPTSEANASEAVTSAAHQQQELEANLRAPRVSEISCRQGSGFITTNRTKVDQLWSYPRNTVRLSSRVLSRPMRTIDRQNVTDPKLEIGLSESDGEIQRDDSDMGPSSESSESPTVPESHFEIRKGQIVDLVITDTVKWLRLKLFLAKKAAGLTDTTSDQDGESSMWNYTGNESSQCQESKKRNHGLSSELEEESGNESHNGDQNHQNERDFKGKAPQSRQVLKLACPYYKYNPDTYNSWRTCPGPGWNDVHRVKEHRYRRHRQPKFRCGRCWLSFKDEQTYLIHQRSPEPCPLRDMEYVEGFDADQERRLKSRKRIKPEPTEAEKWRGVYKILFPHVEENDIPSPFNECVACKRPAIPISNPLAQCEAYLLQNIPTRLRQTLSLQLEYDLNIVEEDLRRKASECVSTLLKDAFHELRNAVGNGESSNATARQSASDLTTQDVGSSVIGVSGSVLNSDTKAYGQYQFLADSEYLSREPTLQAFLEALEQPMPALEDLNTNPSNFDQIDPFTFLEEPELGLDGDGMMEFLLGPHIDDNDKKESDSGYVSNKSERES